MLAVQIDMVLLEGVPGEALGHPQEGVQRDGQHHRVEERGGTPAPREERAEGHREGQQGGGEGGVQHQTGRSRKGVCKGGGPKESHGGREEAKEEISVPTKV